MQFYILKITNMKIIKTLKSLLIVTALGTSVTMASCKKDHPAPPVPDPTPTVYGIAKSDTSFSLLVAAIDKAGLKDVLNDLTKSYTIFAPTNTAFRAAGITQGAIDAALAPDLAAIITYHALGSKVVAADVPVSDAVTTLNTKKLFASSNANGVFLNGVKVITPNLNASNGVVHVIGKVLVPPTQTIAQIVIASTTASTPEFTLLLAAVSRAGLAGVLSGNGKYTVFAPTNAAFIAAGAPFNNAATIATADSATVRKIVLAHVLGTNVFAGDLIVNGTWNTANPLATITPQQTLTITGATALKITGSTAPSSSNIITTPPLFNIVATNGVIHVIDKVLL